jgi:hypothetical protein
VRNIVDAKVIEESGGGFVFSTEAELIAAMDKLG